MDDLHSRIEELTVEEMNRILKNKAVGNIDVEVVTRTGDTEGEIIKYVEEEKIDLVVMSTHGIPGIADLIVGSVAEKVVDLATVPVVTIRPDSENNYEYDLSSVAGSFSS